MTIENISVSIIIPVLNEAPHIQQTLRTFLVQDYPSNLMQILVLDGMSTDNTRAMIQSFNVRHPQLRIQLVDNPGKIVPTGLNLALRQAKGEIIIRVDGHTRIAPDYVRQCIKALERTDADNAGGRMNAVGRNPFGKAVALATSTPFGIGGGRFHY
jgi:cellulose synthase/poly-beta-1,6-N-acetylglucosamine synthase-like glycosyltransferase